MPGIDLPFVQDEVRRYGEAGQRQRFHDLSIAELKRRGVPWCAIEGPAEDRLAGALAAIAAAGIMPAA